MTAIYRQPIYSHQSCKKSLKFKLDYVNLRKNLSFGLFWGRFLLDYLPPSLSPDT